MSEWTPDARTDLDDYLGRVAALCRAQGDDADEVTAHLREHVIAELDRDTGLLVTRDRLAAVLSRLGTPEQVAGAECDASGPAGSPGTSTNGPPRPPRPPRPPVPKRSPARRAKFAAGCSLAVFTIFAVVIPLAAVLVEALFHVMADTYVDPIPTVGHVVLLTLVPFSLAFAAAILNREERRLPPGWYDAARAANGFALVVSGVYALAFLPFAPFALLGIMAAGLGLLPLAPYFTLTAAIISQLRLRRVRRARPETARFPLAATLAGCLVAVLAFGGLHGPQLLIARGMYLALSDEPDEQVDGIRMLRTLGGEDRVLDACYGSRSFGGAPLERLGFPYRDNHSREEYRRLYFQLTGRPFNSVRRPESVWARSRRDTWEEAFVTDDEIGGQSVAGIVPGLGLFASTMDVDIESGPALAYVEWTTVFRNRSSVEREARAQVVVPHESVGSRLTLWIDGEEREAAFGSRLQVRDAYQEIAVVQRRDPALLTTMGRGRLLLQCFPVPAGGEMKVKIGLTVPLLVRDGTAHLRLPYYAERNFSIPREFQHEVWASGDARIDGAIDCAEQAAGGFLAKGKRTDFQLVSPDAGSLAMAVPGLAKGGAFEAKLGRAAARMTLGAAPDPQPNAVCLVVDGSRSLGAVAIDWGRLCTLLPMRSRIAAVFAGDRVAVWRDEAVRPTAAESDAMTAWLRRRAFAGGRDAVPALEKAWDLVAAAGGGVVLWIHGPMPVRLSATDGLRQRLERQTGIAILSVQVVPGPNRIEEALQGRPGYRRIDAVDSLGRTLAYAAANLRVQDVTRTYELALRDAPLDKTPGGTRAASDQLVRLAVNDRIGELLRRGGPADKRKAVTLAVSTRLVTPVSGAVVLERQEQYERHGLDPNARPDPSDGTSGPNTGGGNGDIVPEPGALGVLLAGLLGLKLRRRRRRM
jgi:hypothetical protein